MYKWVAGNYQGFDITACMLLQPPFDGVVVEFGDNVEVFEHGIEFMWRVIDNPNMVDDLTSDNTELSALLERVVYDRLSEGTTHQQDMKDDQPSN